MTLQLKCLDKRFVAQISVWPSWDFRLRLWELTSSSHHSIRQRLWVCCLRLQLCTRLYSAIQLHSALSKLVLRTVVSLQTDSQRARKVWLSSDLKVSTLNVRFSCFWLSWRQQHLFSCPNASELIKACIEAARNMGITLKQRKEAITFYQFENYRFGEYSDDLHITSLAEFNVQKISHKAQVGAMNVLVTSFSSKYLLKTLIHFAFVLDLVPAQVVLRRCGDGHQLRVMWCLSVRGLIDCFARWRWDTTGYAWNMLMAHRLSL